jgi:hypothetical protein
MARDKVDINIIFGMLDSFGQLPENVVERTSTYTQRDIPARSPMFYPFACQAFQ